MTYLFSESSEKHYYKKKTYITKNDSAKLNLIFLDLLDTLLLINVIGYEIDISF